MIKCPVYRGNEHGGPKETLPARTYNILVNHRRQMLYTTRGHPARWNDKTLALFDKFISDICKGVNLQNNKKFFYQRDENGIIKKKITKAAGYCVTMGINHGLV